MGREEPQQLTVQSQPVPPGIPRRVHALVGTLRVRSGNRIPLWLDLNCYQTQSGRVSVPHLTVNSFEWTSGRLSWACPAAVAMCPRSYLVDPASSHMLVSKIKPCMSKYKLVPSETADGSLNQLWFIGSSPPTWITVVILELIHASKRRLPEGVLLLGTRPARPRPATLVNSG